MLSCATLVWAQTAEELIDTGKNTDNVPVQGMGYHLHNCSPLSQINKSNVKRLVPIWSLSLQNNFGETAQPTVHNGVMYVINATQTLPSTVSIASGLGGNSARRMSRGGVPLGGSMWTFALMAD